VVSVVPGFAALPRTGRPESAPDFPAKQEAQPESTAIFLLRKQLEKVEKREVMPGCTVRSQGGKIAFSFLHPWLRKRYLPVALLAL
jgi:hypothetical protein